MKALTFKKSALAAALLVAAGSAVAADAALTNKTVASGTTVGSDVAITGIAVELAKASQGSASALTDDQLLEVAIPTAGSIADGSTVTFSFTNGGLASATYRLAKLSGSPVAASFVDTTLNSVRTNAAGDAIEQVSFIVNETLAAGSSFYLVREAAVSGGALVADQGNIYTVTKTAANNAKLTASVAVDNPNVSDDSIYSAKKDIAIAKTGLKVNGFDTGLTSNVDFTEGALEFTFGKTVSESGFSVENIGYDATYANTGTIFPVSDAALDMFTADLTLTMDNCDAVKVTNNVYSVSINNGANIALTRDTAGNCVWTADAADVHVDKAAAGDDYELTVSITVDGETKITDNKVTLGYDVKYNNATSVLKGTETVSLWSTDVIAVSGQELMFPLLTAANGNSSAFSLVKVDNSGVTSATDILISGTVEQIEFVDGEKTSKFISFDNYKLNQAIAAKSLGQFSGDDIIDSLLTPVGSDEFGYETTAVEGLKKEAIHHISVKLQVSEAETKNGKFGKVVAYNSTRTGRIGVVSQ